MLCVLNSFVLRIELAKLQEFGFKGNVYTRLWKEAVQTIQADPLCTGTGKPKRSDTRSLKKYRLQTKNHFFNCVDRPSKIW